MGKMKQLSLVVLAFSAGALVSLHFSADAAREGSRLPVDELRTFAEVYNAVKQGYVEPVADQKLMANAITGMLANLDPHSAYLDQEAYKELQVGTHGEFGGLGIEVGMESGLVSVVSPIEDTPAYRAGIKAGDLIYKIDGKTVKGLSLNQAVKLMRGKANTKVKLGILRKNHSEPLEFQLVREIIKVRSVKSNLIEPGYGYLRITQFQETTIDSMAKHLHDLYQKGPLKGLVIDLRNDPGGLLYAAIGVSAAFLPNQAVVVTTDGRVGDAKSKFLARPSDYQRSGSSDPLHGLPPELKKVPIVVLVNSGTASASEIVAGALQDHQRAKVLGTTTFGKGSVQTVLPLPNNTAIKLTTARYFTPSGRSIQAKGILPDLYVPEDPEQKDGDQVSTIREVDLDHHLQNGMEAAKPATPAKSNKPVSDDKSSDAATKPTGNTSTVCVNDKKPPKRIDYGSADDYQLKQALLSLKGQPVAVIKAPPEKPAETSNADED